MPTHSLDALILAVRSAAVAAQRSVTTDEMRRRGQSTETGHAPLTRPTRTRIERVRLDIPVTVTEVSDPARPWRRRLALRTEDGRKVGGTAHLLSIDVGGSSLNDATASVDDLVICRFSSSHSGAPDHGHP